MEYFFNIFLEERQIWEFLAHVWEIVNIRLELFFDLIVDSELNENISVFVFLINSHKIVFLELRRNRRILNLLSVGLEDPFDEGHKDVMLGVKHN